LTFPTDHRGAAVTGYVGWVLKADDGTSHPERGVGLTPNMSEVFADAAIELIDRPRDGRPFFMQVNFTSPHDPRFFPRGYERAYDAAKLPLPRNFAAVHPFDHGNINGRDEVLLPRPLTAETIRDELAVYYALIEHMDAQIGRIVAALEESGMLAQTLVIFTSDHGMAVGSHGLAGKQNMYDHTIRVPLILAGPGIPQNASTEALCYLRDLYPTVCDLCGVEAPADLDGRSLRSVLADPTSAGPHPFVVGYFTNTQRMIRTPRWKLSRYSQAGREQLFDLQADPDELHDLIHDPSSRATADELRTELAKWLREHGDPLEAATK
jgi:arylsulfatase A-like enzyme